jgi:hypothetical protein
MKAFHLMNEKELTEHVVQLYKEAGLRRGRLSAPTGPEVLFMLAEAKRMQAELLAMMPTEGGVQ